MEAAIPNRCTSLLKEGTNTLEIRIANRWVNRLPLVSETK